MVPQRFDVSVPDDVLADLRIRLQQTRWPDDPGNEDWRYGTSVGYLKGLVEHWIDRYDWRAVERQINSFENYRVEIDGVPVHFLHRKSSRPGAVPLLLTHGWPWTFWDFRDMITPLAEPPAGEIAFDVVVPSLPGFAFSSPLAVTGIGVAATARMWRTLMRDVLGFTRFAAMGGDFGAVVTQRMAMDHPEDLIGVHLTRYRRPAGRAGLAISAVTADDYAADEAGDFERNEAGARLAASHLTVHTTDPQTLAIGLADSPVGLAAWLVERRRAWSDCDGDLDKVYSRDDLITSVMLYWVTGTAWSSLRYYWETAREPAPAVPAGQVIACPVAIGVLPRDISALPRSHAQADTELVRWTRFPTGGHFGPYEVPDLLVADLRAFLRPLA